MNAPSSDGRFEIGEVAIYYRPGHPNHAKECVIASALVETGFRDTWTGKIEKAIGHEVEMRDGIYGPHGTSMRYGARLEFLRKRRPPREDLKVVRWSECPWQPEKINVA